jgi:hypothetical protein
LTAESAAVARSFSADRAFRVSANIIPISMKKDRIYDGMTAEMAIAGISVSVDFIIPRWSPLAFIKPNILLK